MKKIISVLLMITLCLSLAACGSESKSQNGEATTAVIDKENNEESTTAETAAEKSTTAGAETTETDSESDESTAATDTTGSKTLVAYFSATGNTKSIAESIADGLSADIYEIVPKEPYTDADLDYNDDNSRSTLEMNDSSARPEISGTVENFEQYDTIFLGYPIWWGDAPRIMDTFVESYDFTGKTVIPFCTSGGSGIGSSADTLEKLAGTGNWMDGQRFSSGESAKEVQEWAKQF